MGGSSYTERKGILLITVNWSPDPPPFPPSRCPPFPPPLKPFCPVSQTKLAIYFTLALQSLGAHMCTHLHTYTHTLYIFSLALFRLSFKHIP